MIKVIIELDEQEVDRLMYILHEHEDSPIAAELLVNIRLALKEHRETCLLNTH